MQHNHFIGKDAKSFKTTEFWIQMMTTIPIITISDVHQRYEVCYFQILKINLLLKLSLFAQDISIRISI